MKHSLTNLLIFLISIYQTLISPWLPRACRFYPSCSEYTKQALKQYGVSKGALLAIRRVLRCNPFFPGGYDPLK